MPLSNVQMCRILCIQGHVGFRRKLDHSRSQARELFGAEDVIERDEKPVFPAWRRRLRRRATVTAFVSWFDQPHTGIATPQRPVDLFLEFIDGLNRVPAGRPEKRR